RRPRLYQIRRLLLRLHPARRVAPELLRGHVLRPLPLPGRGQRVRVRNPHDHPQRDQQRDQSEHRSHDRLLRARRLPARHTPANDIITPMPRDLFALALILTTLAAASAAAPILDKQKLLDRQTFWDNRDWDWYAANI